MLSKRLSISLKRVFSVSDIERASVLMLVCRAFNSSIKRPFSSCKALIFMVYLCLSFIMLIRSDSLSFLGFVSKILRASAKVSSYAG